MNQASQSNSFSPKPVGKRLVIALAVLVLGCAATGAWLLSAGGERESLKSGLHPENQRPSAPMSAKPQALADGEVRAADSAPVKQATPVPDSRFVRVMPPRIPAVTSPEAQRMILEMQNAYRCQHSGNRRVTLDCIPGLAGDEVPDMQALCSSLKQSLGTLPDSCYVNAALPQLANPRTPSALMDVLYQDLSQRPNPIRLRTLFIIAGIEGHPLARNAMREMSAILRTDFQQDWGRWEQAVTQTVTHEERGMRAVSCRSRQ